MAKDNDRTFTYGYNRSVSGKVSNVAKKYSGYHYHEDGTIVVTDDWKDREDYHIDINYKPYAVIETLSGKEKDQIDRTIYDKEGVLTLQIHSGDHNRPKYHKYGTSGEHAHDYYSDKQTKKIKNTSRDLTKKERKENNDIL